MNVSLALFSVSCFLFAFHLVHTDSERFAASELPRLQADLARYAFHTTIVAEDLRGACREIGDPLDAGRVPDTAGGALLLMSSVNNAYALGCWDRATWLMHRKRLLAAYGSANEREPWTFAVANSMSSKGRAQLRERRANANAVFALEREIESELHERHRVAAGRRGTAAPRYSLEHVA